MRVDAQLLLRMATKVKLAANKRTTTQILKSERDWKLRNTRVWYTESQM